ncbi:MAG: GNAT family N-acetyltransferase [Polyangiaceae bacterium]
MGTADYPIRLGTFDAAGDWSGFDSGDQDLNEFIRDDAVRLIARDVSRVYVAYEDERPAGYIALLADTVILKTGERKHLDLKHRDSKAVPAVKVGRLAIDRETRTRIRGAGQTLMWLAFHHASLVRSRLGCRLLTVDAYKDSVSFYAQLGFVPCKSAPKDGECPTCGKPIDRCPHCAELIPAASTKTVSMYFDLKTDPLPSWATEVLARRS